jgi:hypothetical protein
VLAVVLGALAFAGTASAAPKDFSVRAKQYESHRDGDGFVFHERLFRHGHQVGHNRVNCHEAARHQFVCGVKFVLNHGRIFARGPVRNGKTQRIPIYDGTGRYKNATGVLKATRKGPRHERETFLFD